MAAIADLDPCRYFPVRSDALIAIGWLERETRFAPQQVAEDFYTKLKSLCVNPWEPMASAGKHCCSLCQFDPPSFHRNVFIPYSGSIYVAPVGILHYIAAHRYRPPEVFISAVLACPEMRSAEYMKALLSNGGRSLIHAGRVDSVTR